MRPAHGGGFSRPTAAAAAGAAAAAAAAAEEGASLAWLRAADAGRSAELPAMTRAPWSAERGAACGCPTEADEGREGGCVLLRLAPGTRRAAGLQNEAGDCETSKKSSSLSDSIVTWRAALLMLAVPCQHGSAMPRLVGKGGEGDFDARKYNNVCDSQTESRMTSTTVRPNNKTHLATETDKIAILDAEFMWQRQFCIWLRSPSAAQQADESKSKIGLPRGSQELLPPVA